MNNTGATAPLGLRTNNNHNYPEDMKTEVTVTQEELRALSNCVQYAAEQLNRTGTGSHADVYLSSELDLAHKTCAYIGQELYEAWKALPNGSTLKEIYRDDVWHPEPEPTNNHDPEGRGPEGAQSADKPGGWERVSDSDKPSRRGPRRPSD